MSTRSSSQRRPRLLRASATEPTILTSLDMSHSIQYRHHDHHYSGSSSPGGDHSCGGARSRGNSGSTGAGGGSSGGGSRATDLLNHVAYLSSCATSPVTASFTGNVTNTPFLDRLVPRRYYGGSRPREDNGSAGGGSSSNTGGSSSKGGLFGSRGASSRGSSTSGGSDSTTPALPHATSNTAKREHRTDEMLGSSPASMQTNASLDDLGGHHFGRYYSFPSFDTWDPDSQDKEEDDDD